MNIATLLDTSARTGFSSPSKLPMLMEKCLNPQHGNEFVFSYRTEVAILNANAAWKVVEAETSNTDWEASEMGPSLGEEEHV